jgi:hypothetical protein
VLQHFSDSAYGAVAVCNCCHKKHNRCHHPLDDGSLCCVVTGAIGVAGIVDQGALHCPRTTQESLFERCYQHQSGNFIPADFWAFSGCLIAEFLS